MKEIAMNTTVHSSSTVYTLPFTKDVEDIAIAIILPSLNTNLINDKLGLLKLAAEEYFLFPNKFKDVNSELYFASTVVRVSLMVYRYCGWRNFGTSKVLKDYSYWSIDDNKQRISGFN